MAMGMDEDDDEEDEEGQPGGRWARLQAEARAAREAEGEDATNPDEVDVPQGVAARVRFQKYRCVCVWGVFAYVGVYARPRPSHPVHAPGSCLTLHPLHLQTHTHTHTRPNFLSSVH